MTEAPVHLFPRAEAGAFARGRQPRGGAACRLFEPSEYGSQPVLLCDEWRRGSRAGLGRTCRRPPREPRRVASQRAPRSGAVLDRADSDLVEAQLSALLESVEGDRAHARPATEPSRGSADVAPTPSPQRLRKPARERARPRRQRRATTRADSSAGFAPKTVSFEPAWAGTAYYIIAAVVLATGLGLLCARLLT
jgi:hypothetical protein